MAESQIPHLVLARKWRPERFSELVGQEHVTRTLGEALKRGRIAHAFLFTGIRGVGKTTAARILARCLNCEKGPTAEPCGSRTAISAVVLPFPQPISRTRSHGWKRRSTASGGIGAPVLLSEMLARPVLAAVYAALDRPQDAMRERAIVARLWQFLDARTFATQFGTEEAQNFMLEGLKKAGFR